MSKIKLNLNSLSIPDKIAKGRQIVTSLESNSALFPTPHPTLSEVTTATDLLEVSQNEALFAKSTAQAKTSRLRESEDQFDAILRRLAGYVDTIAGDDETLIMTAGLDVKSVSPPTTAPTVPAALGATEGDHAGEIDLGWDTVKGAKSYPIERSQDPNSPASWAQVAITTKSAATIGGLVSGTRYWFRVAAITSGGQSGWSEPATKIAP